MDAREKIIETAMRLFSAQGYSTTSLSQVAKEAQVSKALIFWHFENKESLFRTAVQRTFEPYIINVVDDLEGLGEVDQIKRLIDEYYDFVSKNIYSVKFFLGLMLREEKHPDDLVAHLDERRVGASESDARRHAAALKVVVFALTTDMELPIAPRCGLGLAGSGSAYWPFSVSRVHRRHTS
jgi:AcrR family transcriptional regulator